jgi:hypothetical protein
MRYLKKFENSKIKDLSEISGQYLVNLTDNNYIIKYKEIDGMYFHIEITHEDKDGFAQEVYWDFIGDDIITYIQYMLSTMDDVNFDVLEIETYSGFSSYMYQNKMKALISGQDIKNLIGLPNSIRNIQIVFRIGPQ